MYRQGNGKRITQRDLNFFGTEMHPLALHDYSKQIVNMHKPLEDYDPPLGGFSTASGRSSFSKSNRELA